jgi:hypothetical protein
MTPPLDCVSLTGFYPRAPVDVKLFSFGILPDIPSGMIPFFRVFIPPGTVLLDLNIIETGKQMAIARHMGPPLGSPYTPPIGYTPDNYFKLNELIAADCWAAENTQDSLYIASDGFTPPLEENKAGWLYVKVGGGQYSNIYDTHFSARVDTSAYNTWWDKCIKNESGWEMAVQSILTYAPMAVTSEIYQGSVNGVTVSVELIRETATDGVALITVGSQTNNTAYRLWEHGGIKTVYVSDVGYLEIIGSTMKIDVFSGITLNIK